MPVPPPLFSFITPAQFLVRYDFRWVGKNITDDGVPATYAACVASPVLAAFIEEASEMVMGASAVAARYSIDDLSTYGGALLTRITCDLVMGLILKRRVRAEDDNKAFTAAYLEALDYLEQLRRGERIFFSVPNVPEAGLPATETMSPPIGFPGAPLITNNSRIFGTIGWDRNYGYGNGG